MEDKCIRCGKVKKIYAKGKCASCYNYLNMDKEKHKEYVKRWKEKNPNYFKEYYIRQKNEKMQTQKD